MTATDWKARAEREAAAIIAGDEGDLILTAHARAVLVRLLAVAWLQGVNLGCHETLAEAEQAFDRLKASL